MDILEISDGTTTVNMLSADYGFHLNRWQPAIAQPKRGGVFQSSSLSEGRKLVDRKFENIQDNFNFDVRGSGQQETILYMTSLINLLEQATEYWTGNADKVWIKAKAKCEENARYALIVNYSWPEINHPFSRPDNPFSNVTELASMINMDLGLEHKLWLANEPGTGECAEASSVQDVDLVEREGWTNVTTSASTGFARGIVEDTANNVIIVGFDLAAGEVQWSANGTVWNAAASPPAMSIFSMIYANDNYVYAAGQDGVQNGIWRSNDGGDNWTRVFSTDIFSGKESLYQATDGFIYAVSTATSKIYRSNNGTTWTDLGVVSGDSIDAPNSLFQDSVGVFYTTSDNPPLGIYATSDIVNNVWTKIASTNASQEIIREFDIGTLLSFGGNDVFSAQVSNNTLWSRQTVFNISVGAVGTPFKINDNIYILVNDGVVGGPDIYKTPQGTDWQNTVSLSPAVAGTPTGAASFGGKLYVGAAREVFEGNFNTVSLGRTATCKNEIYLTNKQNMANLTHIKIDDGGVFTDIFPIATFPQTLLPAVPTVNDALYFGSDTAIFDSGPFSGLVFDIDTIAISTTSYTITWEYWNGAWVTLNVRDNTNTESGSVQEDTFSEKNVNSVHWEQPPDWTTTTIDGITGYWVRARLSALTGVLTPPTQQNRDIYTIVLPYVNIASTEIIGNITAISQLKLTNQSDEDGRGGSAPDLWDNRIISGLRNVGRGENFQAYINIADEQNPVGVTITDTGANTAFAADATTPTGRRATYNPAGVEAMATQVTIALGPSIARDFYGKFHAFLRVQRTAGAITDFDIQLQIVSGSGGIQFTTQSKQVQTTTQWELIDFGQIQMPVGGTFKSTDLGDITEIRVQASAASGTPNLNMYDLILIPVDEWSIDSVDFANTTDSIIGRDDDVPKLLDVDSITNPKIDIQSLVRTEAGLITSVYDPISPGKAILQENVQQRLWFLAAQTDQTGTPTAWIAPPEIAHSIQLFKNERYLTLSKGD